MCLESCVSVSGRSHNASGTLVPTFIIFEQKTKKDYWALKRDWAYLHRKKGNSTCHCSFFFIICHVSSALGFLLFFLLTTGRCEGRVLCYNACLFCSGVVGMAALLVCFFWLALALLLFPLAVFTVSKKMHARRSQQWPCIVARVINNTSLFCLARGIHLFYFIPRKKSIKK